MTTAVAPTPTVAKPPTPMVKHLIEKNPDGTLKDLTLCGKLWDRYLGTDLTKLTCEDCLKEAKRRHGG